MAVPDPVKLVRPEEDTVARSGVCVDQVTVPSVISFPVKGS